MSWFRGDSIRGGTSESPEGQFAIMGVAHNPSPPWCHHSMLPASSDFPDIWIPAPFFCKPRLRETVQTTAPVVQASQDHRKCFVDHSHVTMSRDETSLLEGLGEEGVYLSICLTSKQAFCKGFPQIIPQVLELIPCSSETPCIYRFPWPSPCSRNGSCGHLAWWSTSPPFSPQTPPPCSTPPKSAQCAWAPEKRMYPMVSLHPRKTPLPAGRVGYEGMLTQHTDEGIGQQVAMFIGCIALVHCPAADLSVPEDDSVPGHLTVGVGRCRYR